MPLTSSGQIDLNAMHVEAGGTSGTECTLNDADIRDMISRASGAQMGFNEWYGASSAPPLPTTITAITTGYASAGNEENRIAMYDASYGVQWDGLNWKYTSNGGSSFSTYSYPSGTFVGPNTTTAPTMVAVNTDRAFVFGQFRQGRTRRRHCFVFDASESTPNYNDSGAIVVFEKSGNSANGVFHTGIETADLTINQDNGAIHAPYDLGSAGAGGGMLSVYSPSTVSINHNGTIWNDTSNYTAGYWHDTSSALSDFYMPKYTGANTLNRIGAHGTKFALVGRSSGGNLKIAVSTNNMSSFTVTQLATNSLVGSSYQGCTISPANGDMYAFFSILDTGAHTTQTGAVSKLWKSTNNGSSWTEYNLRTLNSNRWADYVICDVAIKSNGQIGLLFRKNSYNSAQVNFGTEENGEVAVTNDLSTWAYFNVGKFQHSLNINYNISSSEFFYTNRSGGRDYSSGVLTYHASNPSKIT